MPPGALVMIAGIDKTATASVAFVRAVKTMLHPVIFVRGFMVQVKVQLSPLNTVIGLTTAIYTSLALNTNAVSSAAVSVCPVTAAVNDCPEADARYAKTPTATGSVTTLM